MKIDHRDIERGEILAWVRWEFIRRNPEYVNDWERFDSQFDLWFKKNGYWWDNKGPIYDERAWFFFCSKVAPAAKTICERWKIADPYPPSWEFDLTCMRKVGRATVVMPTLNGNQHAWNLKAFDPVLFSNPNDRAEEELRDIRWNLKDKRPATGNPRYLQLEIDVTESIKQILSDVGKKVEIAKRLYGKKIGPSRKLKKQGRPIRIRDAGDYSGYLRVWDLRMQGKTFKEIAKLEFPNEMRLGVRLNPTVARVRAQYKRACELMKWASEK